MNKTFSFICPISAEFPINLVNPKENKLFVPKDESDFDKGLAMLHHHPENKLAFIHAVRFEGDIPRTDFFSDKKLLIKSKFFPDFEIPLDYFVSPNHFNLSSRQFVFEELFPVCSEAGLYITTNQPEVYDCRVMIQYVVIELPQKRTIAQQIDAFYSQPSLPKAYIEISPDAKEEVTLKFPSNHPCEEGVKFVKNPAFDFKLDQPDQAIDFIKYYYTLSNNGVVGSPAVARSAENLFSNMSIVPVFFKDSEAAKKREMTLSIPIGITNAPNKFNIFPSISKFPSSLDDKRWLSNPDVDYLRVTLSRRINPQSIPTGIVIYFVGPEPVFDLNSELAEIYRELPKEITQSFSDKETKHIFQALEKAYRINSYRAGKYYSSVFSGNFY